MTTKDIRTVRRMSFFIYFCCSFNDGHTVIIIVTKHAVPPITFETGSAQKTPDVPSPPIIGSRIVSGTTIITLRNNEKNTACLGRFRATYVDWPTNCSVIMKKPQK